MLVSFVYVVVLLDFCWVDKKYGVLGMVGRMCSKLLIGMDSCFMLCCGWGYNIVNRVSDVKCNCVFIWCC